MIFAVTDIETTGSHASGNSITEIAVVLTDGREILDQFTTFIQPSHSIPLHITELTGITNDMVEGAPLFSEIAEELLSFYEDAVFVAHNVGFDFSFIKKGFEECGIRFNPNRLCTVRSARKILPGHRSYSLGKLCDELGIANHARHRALGDTMATVELLHLLVESDKEGVIDKMLKRGNGSQWLPPQLKEEVYNCLPESCGVYYFLNAKGEFLYIGMSVNIKKRIRQHFGGKMTSSRRQEFLKDITDIQHIELGNETIARLYEDAEIRRYWPPHNRAQKRYPKRYTVVDYFDQQGFRRLSVQAVRKGVPSKMVWYGMEDAKRELHATAKSLEIDLLYCGLASPVVYDNDSNNHNSKVDALLEELQEKRSNASFYLKLTGRTMGEDAFVCVERGKFKGYGFIDKEEPIEPQDIRNFITPLASSELTDSILYHAFDEGDMIPIDEDLIPQDSSTFENPGIGLFQ